MFIITRLVRPLRVSIQGPPSRICSQLNGFAVGMETAISGSYMAELAKPAVRGRLITCVFRLLRCVSSYADIAAVLNGSWDQLALLRPFG